MLLRKVQGNLRFPHIIEGNGRGLFGNFKKSKTPAPDVPTIVTKMEQQPVAPSRKSKTTPLDEVPEYAPPLPPHQNFNGKSHEMSPSSAFNTSRSSVDESDANGFGYRSLKSLPGITKTIC